MKPRAFPQCWGCLLPLLLILFPLQAQDAGTPEGESGPPAETPPPEDGPWDGADWDDPLIMEDRGITVTGTAETTQEIRVVDREEIERRNAPDLGTLLQEALHIGVTRYGGYGNEAGINIRGFDSKRVAVLIDGVPANSAQSGKFELSQIDLNAVERIEVIYGGSDTKYNVSGALGGVINIITAKDQKPGLRFGGGLANSGSIPGEYRNFALEKEGPRWEDLADTQNLNLFGSYGGKNYSLKANGFFNRVGNHFRFRDEVFKTTRRKVNNEIHDGGASASALFHLPQSAKLIAAADGYYGNKNIPTAGDSPIKGVQTDFSTRQQALAEAPRVFHDALAAEGSLSHAWQILRYERDSASVHDEHTLTAINRWSWYPHSAVTARFGGDYRFIALDSTDMGKRNRHDGGLYAAGEFKPQPWVLIIPSIKAAFCSSGSEPVTPVPKLGFAFYPADSLTIRNNYFRSFKYPDFQDLYWPAASGTAGNPDLKSEDGWGADLGASYRYKEWWTAEAVLFAQWTVDSIHWSPGSGGIWRPYNVGEAAYFGADGKFSVTVPARIGPIQTIRPGLSYQYIKSYLLSYRTCGSLICRNTPSGLPWISAGAAARSCFPPSMKAAAMRKRATGANWTPISC